MKNIVLIIDDAQEDLDLYQAILEEHGYLVIKACDGQEGLQKIKEEHPIVVISDVVMPGMNGYELLKKIRSDTSTSRLPVLIVTARPKMAAAFLEVGADSFMAKPITGDGLLLEVEKLAHRTQDAMLSEKKVVIFGKDERTLQDMHQQLEKLGCGVVDVKEEQKIISVVQETNPDIFFLAMNVETKASTATLVDILNSWAPPKKVIKDSKNNKHLISKKMHIVLYDEEKEAGWLWIKEREDNDSVAMNRRNLIQTCYKNGASTYIGLFSSYTFISRIQEFLNN